MADMTISDLDTQLIGELHRLANHRGSTTNDLIVEILTNYASAERCREVDDRPGSAARLLHDIRADFEKAGWLDLDLPPRHVWR